MFLYTYTALYLPGLTPKWWQSSGQNSNPDPSEYNSNKNIIIGRFEGLIELFLLGSNRQQKYMPLKKVICPEQADNLAPL